MGCELVTGIKPSIVSSWWRRRWIVLNTNTILDIHPPCHITKITIYHHVIVVVLVIGIRDLITTMPIAFTAKIGVVGRATNKSSRKLKNDILNS